MKTRQDKDADRMGILSLHKGKNKLPDRKRNRMYGHSYRDIGRYFVTICTQDGICHFGSVTGGSMKLNDIGDIVARQFTEIEGVYKNVRFESKTVMPNHVHAVIALNDIDRSVPEVVKALKSLSAKKIRGIVKEFEWQRSYYDSIIRDGEGLGRVTRYIETNPENWHKDAENINSGKDKREYYKEICGSDDVV